MTKTSKILSLPESPLAFTDKNIYYLNGEGASKTLARTDLNGSNEELFVNNYFVESFDYDGEYIVYYVPLNNILDGYISQ